MINYRHLLFGSALLMPLLAKATPQPTPEELAETPKERMARLQALDEAEWKRAEEQREQEQRAREAAVIKPEPCPDDGHTWAKLDDNHQPPQEICLVCTIRRSTACPEGTEHVWRIRNHQYAPHTRYCETCGLKEAVPAPPMTRQQRRAAARINKRK